MISQTNAILAHLQSGNAITPLEALERFGCFRLAARIADLRRDGYNVTVENVTRNGKTFAEYRLSTGISRQVPASSFKKQGQFLGISTISDYNNFAV